MLNLEWLFDDPNGKTFYVWGGANSPLVNRPIPGNTLWAFTADGNGGGKWATHGQVPSSLERTSNALVSSSRDGIGYALGGYAPAGTGPVQGLVAYNMSAQSWTNESTADLSSMGTAVDGRLVYSSFFGEDGILIALDGSDGTTGESGTLDDFSTIEIYDRKSGRWLQQVTTGTPPAKRITFCTVGVHSEASFEIFIMGGFGGFTPLTVYDDVYVLSLPSFTWYKADYTPGIGRTLHSCNPFGRQMIVVGGTSNDDSWQTGTDKTAATYNQDPWPWGLGVFDMSKMQWASEFNPELAGYVTPDVVLAGIKANGASPATWSSSDIENVFTYNTLNQTSNSTSGSSGTTPSSSPSSGPGGGAIAGIAIGAVAVILILIGVLLCIRRSKRQSRARHNPYPHESNAYPMNYTGSGNQQSLPGDSSAPLIEMDGGQKYEKNPYAARAQIPAELDQPGYRQYVGGEQAHEKMGRYEDDNWRHELP